MSMYRVGGWQSTVEVLFFLAGQMLKKERIFPEFLSIRPLAVYGQPLA